MGGGTVPDVSYKVLVLGDCGVGKSSIIRSLAGKDFSKNILTTVAPDFVKVVFRVEEALVELCIWDTPGQERFRSITRQQLKDIQGAVMVYSITDDESFKLVDYWLNLLNEVNQANGDDEEPLAIALIGNKIDLCHQRVVNKERAVKLANRNMLIRFTESSAITGEGLEDLFYRLAYFITDSNNPTVLRRFSPFVISKENLILPKIDHPSEKQNRICQVNPVYVEKHRKDDDNQSRCCCCIQ